MYLRMTSKILINGNDAGKTSSVDINSSWENLTDTAVFMSKNNFVINNENITEKIKKGDKVEIYLGYGDSLMLRFKGYVRKISIEAPYKIECEDEMFRLKRFIIRGYSEQSVTLQKLIDDMLEEAGINDINTIVSDANLGDFQIDRVSIADVLRELRDKYSLNVFFRDCILYAGLPFSLVDGDNYSYVFDGNKASIINDNLEWQDVDDSDIVINAKSENMETNEKIEIFVYYNSSREIVVSDSEIQGSIRTYNDVNRTRDELVDIAKRRLQRNDYTGFSGSFTTFGHKNIKVGDVVNLTSYKYRDRKNGSYYIKSINDSFTKQGYRMTVYLDRIAG